jgi:translation initiation factor 4G
MSPEMLKKRTATIVNEFVSSSNEQEALECLAELPPQACGFLVANLMDKYMNSIKVEERNIVLKLCTVLMPQLQAASTHVETAIKSYEYLAFLLDSMMDVKEAPELLGDVLQMLIKGKACRRDVLDKVLAELRKANKDDEYGVPDDQFQAAHDRLRSKLQ